MTTLVGIFIKLYDEIDHVNLKQTRIRYMVQRKILIIYFDIWWVITGS